MDTKRVRDSEGEAPNEQKQTEIARREALKKLGKYAAYTAPALLATLEGTKAAVILSLINDTTP